MKPVVRSESPFATRPESTYKSGKVVQTNGTTSPEGQKNLVTLGFEPITNTPDQFQEMIKKDIVRWAKVAKSAGIKPQ